MANTDTKVKMDKSEYISNFDNLILNPSTRKIYDGSDFFNVGYWHGDTEIQELACFNLMEKLLEFIPQHQGNILDVGCGLGAGTNYLLKYYSSVVGINMSPQQIERCKVNAPECNFICMDATQLEFEDESFDNIICVEAAFYFDTREKFIKEAWRVLKPGGHLILADIIFENTQHFGDWIVPPENIVEDKDINKYKKIYQDAGFQPLEFELVTDDCWLNHFRYLKSWMEKELKAGDIDEPTYEFNVKAIDGLLISSAIDYLLVSVKKPVK